MQTRIAVVFSFVFAVSGCRVVEPNPPPEAPRIASFTASKTRVASGEEVTLSFTATGATKLELLDDAGHEVQAEGTASAGTAKVAPTRTSFYVLRATGQGGRDTAFVQIAVNEPLKDVFLLAVPATIEAGGSAQLLWGAAGATSVTLNAGSGTPQTLTGTTGTVTVSPTATERYTLTAQGAPGTPPLTATASVDVHPVLASATMTAADGVLAGKTLTFAWRTAGAQRVTITEQTFGPLTTVTEPSSVVMGTFDYVLPDTVPGGIAVADGLPLRFVVSATAGDVTVTQVISRTVGQSPAFLTWELPAIVTAGQLFTISWSTSNCQQLRVLAGGLPVFETLPGDEARATLGSVRLPAPSAMTEYKLVARNALGLETTVVGQVRPVGPPSINTFTLTPTLNAPGDLANAQWTTSNASRVVLRVVDGPTIKTISAPSMVAAGSATLVAVGTTTVELAAYNEAGQSASQTRTVTVTAPATSITPTVAPRGGTATLTWDLSALSIIELVGGPAMPTTLPSGNFVDLATAPNVRELYFADPAGGSARVPQLEGFRFWTLGATHPELWVSVDGFLSYAETPGRSANEDLTAGGSPVIAPFWDDLNLGMGARVLVGLSATTSGERFLVVQWDKVQLASDPMSELTFQAQLFESGQVSFAYKTLTGATDSATVGIRDVEVTQISYNNTPPPPAPGSEVVFFVGGTATGTRAVTAVDSQPFALVARTATGLVFGSAALTVIGAGDVVISEVMPVPEASVATTGQWVELRNNQPTALDLGGMVLTTTGSTVDGGYVIPPNTVVPAGGHLVLGQSLDLFETGGATVNQVLTDAPIASADVLTLRWDQTTLSTFAFDGGTPGTSQVSAPRLLVASGVPAITCTRTTTFGTNGAVGTPGSDNERCDDYAFARTGASYVPPPAGSQLTFSEYDDDVVEVGLPAPFTYFGVTYSRVNVSTNGFVSFGTTLTSSYFSNPTTPSTSTPNAVIGAMWDDLDGNAGAEISLFRLGRRTIVSWDDMTQLGDDGTLHFQIHLLDDGAVEIHYQEASWLAGSQGPLTGDSATVWIEAPDGKKAVVAGINTQGTVTTMTGYRFTPTP